MEHKHNTESHQRSSLERSNAELGDMNEQPIPINIEKVQEGNKEVIMLLSTRHFPPQKKKNRIK